MPRTGPRLKVIRRLGTPLPGLTRKSAEKRPHPPGQHGQGKRRTTKTDYRRRLEEKQKLRFHYGITEGQLRNYFDEAARRRGVTGEMLLGMLERRLDNVVFRLGFAPTIPSARQLVTHGHVHVNGRRVDRAAALVDRGDEISISPRGRAIPGVAQSVESGPQVALPSYLERGADPFTGRVTGGVARQDVPFLVEETAIVEFYAR
jgi:small subunit ribosomal protein S4